MVAFAEFGQHYASFHIIPVVDIRTEPHELVILVFDVDPSHARQKRIVRREGYWVDRISQRREDLYRLKSTQEFED